MKYLALVGIFLVFSVGCLLAPVLVLITLFVFPSYATRVFKTMNRLSASIVGFRGDEGISHECGKSPCKVCKALCRFLSFVLQEKDHCESEQ